MLEAVNLAVTAGSVGGLALIIAYRFGRLEQKVESLERQVERIADGCTGGVDRTPSRKEGDE